ncbi:MAG: hypothetical protein ACRC1K_18220, partial [Planctomycetia bacterium]
MSTRGGADLFDPSLDVFERRTNLVRCYQTTRSYCDDGLAAWTKTTTLSGEEDPADFVAVLDRF